MNALQISVAEKGGVTVVTVKGPVTIGAGDLAVRTTIKDLVSKGARKLVLDMEGVPYMDSTGIGELIAAYASARGQKAEIRLANLTKRIEDLLGVVQLTSLFESFDGVDAAVESYG